MDRSLEAKLAKELPEADPKFVEFLMAWNGLVGEESVPCMVNNYEATYLKRIKRWVQRDYGPAWKPWWKLVLQECLQARGKIVLRRNLFRLEPVGPSPPHRPRDIALWTTAYDLQHYFVRLQCLHPIKVMGMVLFPEKHAWAVHSEWTKRKEWFDEHIGPDRISGLLDFYRTHRERIHETLRTKIPMYSRWETPNPSC